MYDIITYIDSFVILRKSFIFKKLSYLSFRKEHIRKLETFIHPISPAIIALAWKGLDIWTKKCMLLLNQLVLECHKGIYGVQMHLQTVKSCSTLYLQSIPIPPIFLISYSNFIPTSHPFSNPLSFVLFMFTPDLLFHLTLHVQVLLC